MDPGTPLPPPANKIHRDNRGLRRAKKPGWARFPGHPQSSTHPKNANNEQAALHTRSLARFSLEWATQATSDGTMQK